MKREKILFRRKKLVVFDLMKSIKPNNIYILLKNPHRNELCSYLHPSKSQWGGYDRKSKNNYSGNRTFDVFVYQSTVFRASRQTFIEPPPLAPLESILCVFSIYLRAKVGFQTHFFTFLTPTLKYSWAFFWHYFQLDNFQF